MYRLALLLTLATLASLNGANAPAESPLYRGPYLQQSTSSSVVVVWRTHGPATPILRYGTAPDSLASKVRDEAITLRLSADVDGHDHVPRLYQESPEDSARRNPKDHDPSTAPNTYQFEAQVTGLAPDTTYYYAVYDGDKRLAGGDADHFFVTHPPIGSKTDMRIWVLGDSGKGSKDQVMVFDAMRDFVAQSGQPIDHFLHVGDMAYDDGTDWEFQKHFFDPYQSMLRNTVCWPALGNHEGVTSRGISGTGPYFDAYVVPVAGEAGGAPSGSEAYFSFDIAEVHFVCLDSHDLDRNPDGAMAQWLRADLEQADAKWLVAFWHHPPYSKGTHDSDTAPREIEMRENFMPILESAGVDVTLTGHSHIYERSMLMDGAYATPTVAEGVILDDGDGRPHGDGAYRKSEGLHPNEGSISIVAGHGGTTNGRVGTMPVMREISVEHGSVILDIKGDTLTGIMVDKFGATRDLFSLVKQGKVTPTRIANPWQPLDDISLITRHYIQFTDDTPGEAPQHWRAAQGNPSGMVVVANEEKSRHLRAEAAGEPLIGVFGARRMEQFEYETFVRLTGKGNTSAGIVFGYLDSENYDQVVLDATTGTLRISRIAAGAETLILKETVEIVQDKWLKIKMALNDYATELSFDDGPAFTFEPPAVLSNGFVGFLVPPGQAAEYLSFKIRHYIP